MTPVIANFSASNRPTLVFLSCPEVSGNRQKRKKSYMTADGHTEIIQGLTSFYNIWFFKSFF